MSDTKTSSNLGRRPLFSGSGAALAGLATLSMPGLGGAGSQHPDAALLEICSRFHVIQTRINDFFAGGATAIEDDDERDIAKEPFEEQRSEIIYEICQVRATTLDGLRMRANCFVAYCGGAAYYENILKEGEDAHIVAAIFRDLLSDTISF